MSRRERSRSRSAETERVYRVLPVTVPTRGRGLPSYWRDERNFTRYRETGEAGVRPLTPFELGVLDAWEEGSNIACDGAVRSAEQEAALVQAFLTGLRQQICPGVVALQDLRSRLGELERRNREAAQGRSLQQPAVVSAEATPATSEGEPGRR